MQISEKQITTYQELYKHRYGAEISREKALEEGIKLINLVKLVYQPITKNDLKLINKAENEKILSQRQKIEN